MLCITPGVALIVCSAGGGSSLDVIVHFFFFPSPLLLFSFNSLRQPLYIVGWLKRGIYTAKPSLLDLISAVLFWSVSVQARFHQLSSITPPL